MRMAKTYDNESAKQLLPLLRSITREMHDRRRTIRRLEGREMALRASAGERGATLDHGEMERLGSDLATERQALRLAEMELDHLGCSVSEDEAITVLIPGSRGEFTDGFAWSLEENLLRPLSADSAA